MKYIILWRQDCKACRLICDMGVWNHNYSQLVGDPGVDMLKSYLIRNGTNEMIGEICNNPVEARETLEKWDNLYSEVKV